MHYDTRHNNHGLAHDPFKALIAPRPIGWISTVSAKGVLNLAPYSFFNAISDKPKMVMFSSVGKKDSLNNIEETGEFVCSIVGSELREAMNMSSAPVHSHVDEFALSGVTPAPSLYVKPPRVAEASAALECRCWKIESLPAPADASQPAYWMVIGEVVGIYINETYISNGMFDLALVQPLARLGYMDYSVVNAESMFTLNRPRLEDGGESASLIPGPWDGTYR